MFQRLTPTETYTENRIKNTFAVRTIYWFNLIFRRLRNRAACAYGGKKTHVHKCFRSHIAERKEKKTVVPRTRKYWISFERFSIYRFRFPWYMRAFSDDVTGSASSYGLRRISSSSTTPRASLFLFGLKRPRGYL